MPKLRISSGINLDASSPVDLRDYMMRGIEFNAKIGFEALDFDAALTRYAPDNYAEIMKEARDYAESFGLRFEVTHLPFGNRPWTSGKAADDFAASVKRSIDASVILGAKYGVMHPVSTTELKYLIDDNANLTLDCEKLYPFVQYAKAQGFGVVVENMRIAAEYEKDMSTPFVLGRSNGTPEHIKKIAEMLDIGVCWDFGHAHIGGIDPYYALTYIGDRLKMIHVCDNHGYFDEHLPPFGGTIDWKRVAEGLRDAKFDGLFNFEVSPGRVPASCREAYARHLIKTGEVIVAMMEDENE